MRSLERHAWWGLAFMTVVIVVFGVTDVIIGPAARHRDSDEPRQAARIGRG